jgi:hypothetical protein
VGDLRPGLPARPADRDLPTAGGRRKWKTRYDSEVNRRREIEKAHDERARDFEAREKEWRERDSLRGAAVKTPPDDRPL